MIKYYMRPDSNTHPSYSYVVSEDTDSLWNSETCVEVPIRPSPDYDYDMDAEEWVLNQDRYMIDLRCARDIEIARVDKYMLSDFPISAENKGIVETYRQELRDCPDKEVFADRILPECPDVCKN